MPSEYPVPPAVNVIAVIAAPPIPFASSLSGLQVGDTYSFEWVTLLPTPPSRVKPSFSSLVLDTQEGVIGKCCPTDKSAFNDVAFVPMT